ncbi:MAG: DNA-processing protein DprA [Burkholderiales bacterium]
MPYIPDQKSWLALTLVPEIGPRTLRKLLAAFGTPEAVLACNRNNLERVIPARLAARLLASREADAIGAAISWLDCETHHLVTLADADYPRPLLEIADPPAVLYVAGDRNALGAVALAVVGSRSPTPQGLDNAQAFAQALSNAGITVVSGLAEGVDAAAHRGALAGGACTIAVVGTGVDRVYPARNRALAEAIRERGALVSEFPLGTRALPGNFPRRNRLISGLARGCLVVEAALQSGSLITARCALEQGREVFAIPGSIHSPLAKGCHALIKEGAKLVESAADILDELGMAVSTPAVGAPGAPRGEPMEVSRLLPHVGYDPVDIDALCSRSGLPPDVVTAELLALELAGRVAALPGGLYQRRS